MARGSGNLTSEVVLCSFNGAEYIEEQIRSILDQTRPVDQISIYDDQSSDGTPNLVRSVFGSDPRIQLTERPQNLGYIKNFEAGVRASREDIVFFSDQDDRWFPDKVEEILEFFETDPEVQVVFGDLALMNETGKPTGSTFWRTQKRFPLRYPISSETSHYGRFIVGRNVVTGASLAIRSTFAKSLLPFPSGIPHDHTVAIRAFGEKKKVAVLDRPLTWYRIHPRQTIGIKARGTGKAHLESQIDRVRVRLLGFETLRSIPSIINQDVVAGLATMIGLLTEELRHLEARLAIRQGRPDLFFQELFRFGYRFPEDLRCCTSDFVVSLGRGN